MGFFSRKPKPDNNASLQPVTSTNTASRNSSPPHKRSGSSFGKMSFGGAGKKPDPAAAAANGGAAAAAGTPGVQGLKPFMQIPQAPNPDDDPVGYLRSIHSVRERSRFVLAAAKRNQLRHFEVDMGKFADAASYVVSVIKRDFYPDYSTIPPHGRWQHFEAGNVKRLDALMASWPANLDDKERCRRLIDLFLVSVLLDAGAGTRWKYDPPGEHPSKYYNRSEGLAIASLDMFKKGTFSGSRGTNPCQIDMIGLQTVSEDVMRKGLQVGPMNPIEGLTGRTELLQRLGQALENKAIFGDEGRAGNILDYLLSHPSTRTQPHIQVPLPVLWDTLMTALIPIWPPSRTKINGVSLGDAWPLSTLMPESPTPKKANARSSPKDPIAADSDSEPFRYDKKPNSPSRPTNVTPVEEWKTIVPFHKLTQWLTYSLMPPMTKLLGITFPGVELMTGLPEYRNGGLFIDMGVLTLKDGDMARGLRNYDTDHKNRGLERCEVVPVFEAGDDVVVEWRAITVGLLDDLLIEVNKGLGLGGQGQQPGLNLAQMLEAGSWKAGREIAAIQRPNTKEPPIMILSDGTVF